MMVAPYLSATVRTLTLNALNLSCQSWAVFPLPSTRSTTVKTIIVAPVFAKSLMPLSYLAKATSA